MVIDLMSGWLAGTASINIYIKKGAGETLKRRMYVFVRSFFFPTPFIFQSHRSVLYRPSKSPIL